MHPTTRPLVFAPAALGAALSLAACDDATPAPDAARDVPATDVAKPDRPAPVDVSIDAPAVDRPAPVDVALDRPVPADVPAGDTCRGPSVTSWTSDPRMCVVAFASMLRRPRGMAFAANGDLFVVDGDGITVLFDADGDGASGPTERTRFADVPGANHGIAFSPDGAFLYATTPTEVLRWPYARGQRFTTVAYTQVVTGMPPGGHAARAIVFGPDGRLYVDVGSGGNVDQSPADLALRSMIRRFVVPAALTAPMAYASGEVIASGMRNESGLAFDRAGRLWGVENGRDNLANPLGTDIHLDNPAEELNLVDTSTPRFYGYPSCFSEGLLPGGRGPGTQHADPESRAPAVRDDAWCRNPTNVRAPAFAMPAHWAPLGVTEYTGSLLPWAGDLLITSHGSWNRETMQSGRLVARARLSPDGTVRSVEPVAGDLSASRMLQQGAWGAKPVDVKQGPDGAVYVSDDYGNRVLRIGYRPAS